MARCVDLCGDQPLLGSASPCVWLLVVDQPRPWRPKVQDSLQLDREVQDLVDAFRGNKDRPFTLLARHSDQGQVHWFRWWQGQPQRMTHPGGLPSAIEPTLLVCTHGSRDACCGSLGPKLAARLGQDHQVWEVSHLGGHRFAPTLWHLPSWRVYGRVPLEGRWDDPACLRGNAAYEPKIQVLEHYLWQQRGQWPLCIEGGGEHLHLKVRVHWREYGQSEDMHVTLTREKHLGPLSCRDIPEGKLEEYSSYQVLTCERMV